MAWYDANWLFRKSVTIDHTKVGGSLTDFQVRVRFTGDTDIAPAARFDGRDLLVTSDDGETKLAHAPVRYDPIAAEDACWTWFNDPRAVYHNGATYVGGITSDGTVKVGRFVHATGAWAWGSVVTGFQADDHNNPALCVRSDGKILVVYSNHNGLAYSAVSTNAEDVSAWGTPVAFTGSRSYAHLVKLGSGRIYYFFRDGPTNPRPHAYQFSDDDGATWSAKQQFFNVAANRPYFKVTGNQNDATRIDFACTDGHPTTEAATNSVYHFYMLDTAGTLTWHETDGTEIVAALPFTNTDVTLVYSGATNRAWVWDIATDANGNPAIAYTAYPTSADHRYRYAKWNGSAWVDNEIVAAGDTYSVTGEAYYSPGICLDKSDPSIVYLVRLGNVTPPLWKYVTADSGASWTPTAYGNKGGTLRRTLRPMCPLDAHADIPVVWLCGTYTDFVAPSYDTDLIVPFGPACTTTDVDLYVKVPDLSGTLDTTLYLYYGNQSATAQQDVAATFPDDVLVVPGADANWEQLDLIVPAGTVVDKEPSGTLLVIEEAGGTNGAWQRHGGSLGFTTGQSPNFASATALTLVLTLQPQSGGPATEAVISNFSTTTGGFLFRFATADMQPELFLICEANTQVGGKFSDIVLANDVKRRWYLTWSTAAGVIEAWRDLTKSATTYANAIALDAGASAAIFLGSSPHNATQRYKGYFEGVRVVKNKRWSDAEIETEYNNHTDMAGFFTLGGEEDPPPSGGAAYARRRLHNTISIRL